MNTSFEAANAAADRVAINAIVVEAADATADSVTIPVPLYLIARGPLPLAHRTNAVLTMVTEWFTYGEMVGFFKFKFTV